MASAPLALFASTAGCELHPVVVFAVLDHHKRREQGASSVVGALLGTRSGKTVVISDAFAVPTGENGAYDMAYHRTMVQLHERVNPKERVVGWYTTATEVVPAMAGTHGQLSREHQANLVLLTVDASFAGKRLDIKAFDASEFVSKERALLARFAELPVTLTASAPEKLAVDSLINSNPEDDKLDAPATILSELDSLEQSMQALLHSIETVQRYVSKVQKGEIQGNEDVARAISHALAAIPYIEPKTFEKTFASHVQDVLMIVYLANLTRAQIAIADRIQQQL